MKLRKILILMMVFTFLGFTTVFSQDAGDGEESTPPVAEETSTETPADEPTEDGEEKPPADDGTTTETPTPEENGKPKASFGMGLQFGSQTINGTNYNSIRLQPDFGIGPFGIGLDINFEFNGEGEFRMEEWNTWQAVMSKLLYLRWGKKKDFKLSPVYVKIGSIDDFSLGHGLVLYKYSNMLNYPALKKLGFAFDIDFKFIGFETIVGNLYDFDILGGRLYTRPLITTKIPIVKNIELGYTIVGDLDPQNPVPPADKPYEFTDNSSSIPVSVWGIDIGLPVLTSKVFSLLSYVDIVGISGKGTGEILGFAGSIITLIPYKLEFRLFQAGFVPVYFNSFYDAERSVKFAMLDTITNGYGGWLFSSGVTLLPSKKTGNPMLTWSLQIEGAFDDTIKPILTTEFKIDRELILNKLGARIGWTRKEIVEFGDIFDWESVNSIMYFQVEYYISENLALILDYKRTFTVNPSGVLEPFTSTSVSTKINF